MRKPLNAFPAVIGLALSVILCGAFAEEAATQVPPATARYPTAVVTDYVIGCLIANGQSPETLRKCACSIDFIAAAIPYAEYERVETLMRLQRIDGMGRVAAYKGTSWAKDALARFTEVQAESTLRCF